MSNLIDKIGMLIKKEKGSPDRKSKDDSKKSSSEILSELFGVFNADPPKIDEDSLKKSKKSKKKHKKEKKKRSRSSSSSDSDDSDDSRKRKKKKKKSKKQKKSSRHSSPYRSKTPPKINLNLDLLTSTKTTYLKNAVKVEKDVKPEKDIVSVKTEKDIKVERVKPEPQPSSQDDKSRTVTKYEDDTNYNITFNTIIDASQIPMPSSPKEKLDSNDLRLKIDSKSKIQIKNLKFSTVFEETVKKAEEEARKKKEKHEDGELSDSSSSVEQLESSQFPKSSDPSGILKKKAAEEKAAEYEKSKKSKRSESSHKSSRRDRSRSPHSRSRHRSRSRSRSRRHHRSRSRSHGRRYSSKHRSRSRSPYHSSYYKSSAHRGRSDPRRDRRSSRSPTGVRLADSEKKRLLEVARKNAINMLKNGAVPAGAAALPPHTRNQVMAAIQSGGKSVDELTDFCKHLSKKEALGELSSASSNDEISDNEDTRAFHHPFLVKEKAPIVMNIRGGAPLPVRSTALAVVNKDELRMQFPVSSGSQHRDTEWIPVSPKKDAAALPVPKPNNKPKAPAAVEKTAAPPLPLPAAAAPQPVPAPVIPGIPSAPLALPAPGPQAYPPGIEHKPGPNKDVIAMVTAKLSLIRKEQEQSDLSAVSGLGFPGKKDRSLGQFTGSTGAQILTPRELAGGVQAWAKKDQLTRAAPVRGGMGMALLQKMGWTPGQGLGKEGTGTLQPLMLEVKLDTKGLVAREEVGARVNKAKARNVPSALRRGGGNPNGPIIADGKHPVSLLGEYCSKKKLGPPEYELCFECGPDHKKNFLFKVKVGGVAYQPATASQNKKQAKRDSATVALQKLGVLT